jgi:hypothetical protein
VPKGNNRPLSTQAARQLDAGYDHPEGHVFAPLGTSQALIRRGLVTGMQRSLDAGFGDHSRTTITDAGRAEVIRRRAAALDLELNAPTWSAFAPCTRLGCDADTGQCCIDVRRGSRRAVGEAHPLRNPHQGRRQLGPRADSLAHRTGRAS